MALPQAQTLRQSAVPAPRRYAEPTQALQELLTGRADHEAGAWRWTVRRHLVVLRDQLLADHGRPAPDLSHRGDCMARERDALLSRLSVLGPSVLNSPDLEGVTADLTRLVSDAARHLQRRNDLAWDSVARELGGSE